MSLSTWITYYFAFSVMFKHHAQLYTSRHMQKYVKESQNVPQNIFSNKQTNKQNEMSPTKDLHNALFINFYDFFCFCMSVNFAYIGSTIKKKVFLEPPNKFGKWHESLLTAG